MFIEYTHVNNHAIIKDDIGNTKIVPYFDKLKETLIQENIIELLEEEMKRVNENYKYYKEKKFNYIPYATLGCCFLGYFAIPELFKAVGAPEEWLNEMGRICTNYDAIKYMGLIMGIPCGLLMDYTNLSDCYENRRRKNGTISEKELLEQLITYEKAELENLQKNKTNSNLQIETDYEIVKIDVNQIINRAQNVTNLFYNLGYNEKKLYRNFIKGTLDKYYSDNQLKLATEYFEEKGPVLAKKYNVRKER